MNENPYPRTGADDEPWSPSRQRRGLPRLVQGGIALGAIVVIAAMLLPAPRNVREAGRRSQCKNNLKQIGLALHNYHDDCGAFPPAYTVDADGQPLHSWRVLILPYLDEKVLYDTIDLTKAWDDPANAEARATPMPVYSCPSGTGPEANTSYVAIVGNDFAFTPTHPRSMSEFKDGVSNTVMLMEVPRDQTFEWIAPQDGGEQAFLAFHPESKLSHMGGVQVLMGDGSVRFLSATLPPEARQALITTSAGDHVGEY